MAVGRRGGHLVIGAAVGLLVAVAGNAVYGQLVDTAASATSKFVAIALGLAAFLLFEWWVNRPTIGSERRTLDEWRAQLQGRIPADRRRQLDQLAAIEHRITIASSPASVGRSRGSRLRLGGPSVALDELAAHWDHGAGRIVLLGEPGAGKSYAALRLVCAAAKPGTADHPVPELFLLADWYVWHLGHKNSPFTDWLTSCLTKNYRVPTTVAAQLIEAGIVVPVFDGLDEVPAEGRVLCVREIGEYSGKGAHRGFFVTCRAAEYQKLAPQWLLADHTFAIRPLNPDQIVETILGVADRHVGWDNVVKRLREPGSLHEQLFASPLRLVTALDAYRYRDPSELGALTIGEARELIWDRYLTPNEEVRYCGHQLENIRQWLAFIADGTRSTYRQTFRISDLPSLDPHSDRHILRAWRLAHFVFRLLLGASFGYIFSRAARNGAGAGEGFKFGISVGLTAGLVLHLRVLITSRDGNQKVSTAGNISRIRILILTILMTSVFAGIGAVFEGAAGGIIFGLGGGWVGGIVGGFVVGLPIQGFLGIPTLMKGVATAILSSGRQVYRSQSQSSIFNPLILAMSFASAFVIFSHVPSDPRIWTIEGLLLTAVVIGVGPVFELDEPYGFRHSRLYQWWALGHMARRRLIPPRPARFLDWCSGTGGVSIERGTTRLDRSWIRRSGADYEFRHRELQEFLARQSGA